MSVFLLVKKCLKRWKMFFFSQGARATSMRMSQNTLHENFADYGETKVHTKIVTPISGLQESAYLKWDYEAKQQLWESPEGPVTKEKKKKGIKHSNQFILCLGMGTCSSCICYKEQMKDDELVMKNSKTQILLEVYRQISMWNIDFLSAPTLLGRCPTMEGSKCSHYPVLGVFCDSER